MRASVGDLVGVRSAQSKLWGDELVRGYKTFPGEYGFHGALWVEPGYGLVLEIRDNFLFVFIHSFQVWFESHQVSVLRNDL